MGRKNAPIHWKLCACLAATAALAVPTQEFPGWDNLVRQSPNIVIARCNETPPPMRKGKNGAWIDFKDGVFDSDIEVTSVLKGITNLGPSHLMSRFRPRQLEHYLIFSTFHDGSYQAVEAYRIIPLGISFPPDLLKGKSLDEQIRFALEYRLSELENQTKAQQEEKNRLESGLRK